MKAWSRADLLSLFLVILGIASLFSTSNWLTIICFMLASVILLHCVYNARYDLLRYRDFLCHYQAVLSAANDGWIAWNSNNEYVGSSKRFRDDLGLSRSNGISMADVLKGLDEDDSSELSFQISKLKKAGVPFSITVTPKHSFLHSHSLTNRDNALKSSGREAENRNDPEIKIKLCGARVVVSGVETTLLWSSDISSTSAIIASLEAQLRLAESDLNQKNEMLDELPIPVWGRDSALKISYCNKKYAESVGQVREKILMNNIPLIAGTLFGQGHSLAENARKCRRDQSIAQFAVINGARRKLMVTEKHTKRNTFVGFSQDITDEDEISVNFERMVKANYEVLENLSTAIAIFGENMRLVFFNTAYQKLMKLETVWLHAKPTYAEVLDECRNNRQMTEYADFQAYKKSEMSMFTSLTGPAQELVHLPNGKTLRRLVAPYPLGGLLFVFEDVTDSLALQRKNNTLLAVHKETIDHLHEGIMVYGSNNRLKILNNSLLKVWDIEERNIEELKGKHISEVLDELKDKIDFEGDWSEFKENAISSLTDRSPKTGRLMRKDDSVVLFSYTPLPDGAHMLSFIDITDTYMVEKAVMEKNLALKEAHQLRYEFVSAISTELKDPVTNLIGFTELLEHEYYGSLNQKQKEYCRYILDSSSQLYQLINSLLEMVLIDVGPAANLEMSNFVLKDTINEVVAVLEKRAQNKSVKIETHFQNPILRMNGDRKRIKQFLFNIMINAIQASPVNGIVDIRTVVEDDSSVKIIVKDERAERSDNDGYGGIFGSGEGGGNEGGGGAIYRIGLKRRPSSSSANDSVRTHIRRILDAKGASMLLVRALIEQHGGTLSLSRDAQGCSYVICTLPTHCDNSISDEGLLSEYIDTRAETADGHAEEEEVEWMSGMGEVGGKGGVEVIEGATGRVCGTDRATGASAGEKTDGAEIAEDEKELVKTAIVNAAVVNG